jgi:hypothetical protein
MQLSDPQVIAVFVDIATGESDPYNIMNHPIGEAQTVAAADIERRYYSICEGGRFHADDDFEQIFDEVCNQYADEYEDLL